MDRSAISSHPPYFMSVTDMLPEELSQLTKPFFSLEVIYCE
jgi:hypothetical protein